MTIYSLSKPQQNSADSWSIDKILKVAENDGLEIYPILNLDCTALRKSLCKWRGTLQNEQTFTPTYSTCRVYYDQCDSDSIQGSENPTEPTNHFTRVLQKQFIFRLGSIRHRPSRDSTIQQTEQRSKQNSPFGTNEIELRHLPPPQLQRRIIHSLRPAELKFTGISSVLCKLRHGFTPPSRAPTGEEARNARNVSFWCVAFFDDGVVVVVSPLTAQFAFVVADEISISNNHNSRIHRQRGQEIR